MGRNQEKPRGQKVAGYGEDRESDPVRVIFKERCIQSVRDKVGWYSFSCRAKTRKRHRADPLVAIRIHAAYHNHVHSQILEI